MDLNKYWHGIQQGDEKALEGLFLKTNANLCRYALYLTENLSIAEEIVQDVYLKIWQDRNKLFIKGSFKAYLYRSVHNYAINELIKQQSKKSSVNKLLPGESWQEIIDSLDHDDYIIEKIEAKETEKIINDTIKKLPDQCREIFELSRFKHKTNKEIAYYLKISENTVKTQIYRALSKIKEQLF